MPKVAQLKSTKVGIISYDISHESIIIESASTLCIVVEPPSLVTPCPHDCIKMAEAPPDNKTHADSDGQFRRQKALHRSWISNEPDAEFPPEKGRYVYVTGRQRRMSNKD